LTSIEGLVLSKGWRV